MEKSSTSASSREKAPKLLSTARWADKHSYANILCALPGYPKTFASIHSKAKAFEGEARTAMTNVTSYPQKPGLLQKILSSSDPEVTTHFIGWIIERTR